ncbi:hypothetical protein D5S18_19840 [Nocardia panacis]|uniref:Uncharacterized protein n=1 Tax=Nocardia panacis TaxID=2340916 RepID=A0A3A4K4W4_9NOCA|nr:CorA family divalent cation transporter [Nocardia panacis]RJO73471.1 hypothetical protein D5S18_19840 [Nocardia panacis]
MSTPLLRAANGRFDTEVLHRHWIPLARADDDTAAVLRERLGVDFPAAGERPWETGDFRYLPVTANYRSAEAVTRETIVFALGADFLVTLQPSERFLPFDGAAMKMRRDPALTGSPHGVMYALLWALNEASELVGHGVTAALDADRAEIDAATRDTDLGETISRLNATERTISRTLDTQLQLSRAARHLGAEIPSGAADLDAAIRLLGADVDGVRQQAEYAHNTVRYLQQSVLTWLSYSRRRSWRGR